MKSFVMNGILWRVEWVSPDSPYLIDRTNTYRLATTDPKTQCIYLSLSLKREKELQGMADRVLVHELGHCVIFSYNLFEQLHAMVHPNYWIPIEEWICNFVADYGLYIFSIAKTVSEEEPLYVVSRELERLVA